MSARRISSLAVLLLPLVIARVARPNDPAEAAPVGAADEAPEPEQVAPAAPEPVAPEREMAPSDEQPTCLHAFEWSQRFRTMGELRAARQYLEACMQPSCREVMRTRCAAWLAEVDRDIPTVRLVVTGVAPAGLLGARATIDGELVQDGLGAAIAVDPREHVATLLLPDGRRLSSRFTAVLGAKDQLVELRPPPSSVPATPAPVAPEHDDSLGIGLTIAGFGLPASASSWEPSPAPCR